MSNTIQSIRGMHDVAPNDSSRLAALENTLKTVLTSFAYREIRTPILEPLDLFKRSVGEVTDIVEKEMYAFADRNGDMLAMRPEGTAGVVRAGIQGGWLRNQTQRLWYLGPFFRYERPQKGRYRQFHQLGVECFGFDGPDIDAELIVLAARMWRRLGIELDNLELQINTLGDLSSRAVYREALIDYLNSNGDILDDDARRRLNSNPLRILDSKNPGMQDLIKQAPILLDYIDAQSKQHFERLQQLLQAAGIDFSVNPRLVRGLDYYTRTVFEWTTNQLGAQGTICAGGRYDGLVAQLGGGSVPAAGFAIGIERLLELVKQDASAEILCPEVYVLMMGDVAETYAFALVERVRSVLPNTIILVNCGGGSIKSQMKRADRSGAKLALIIGEEEATQQKVCVKYLQEKKQQVLVNEAELVELLNKQVFA